jgi:putative CocE/NonD family hydrolase
MLDGLDHLDSGPVVGLLRLASAGRRLGPAYEALPLTRAGDALVGGGQTYREWLTAPHADDPLWAPMRLARALDRVDVPVLLLEGWQDPFVAQMIQEYEHLRRRGVEVALTIGPWTHVQTASRGAPILTGETLDWLGEHLAGGSHRHRRNPVHIFVTGAREWRHLPAWPPATQEQTLYLQPDGRLGPRHPSPSSLPSTFRFDPADPTPAVGGRVINPALAGTRDNRKLEQRDDVLTFTTPPLDEPLEVIGNPVTELVHRTDNPCADIFVRICEVTAKGHSLNLSDGFVRLSTEKHSGSVVIRLDAIAHRFASGNRIRLQVSGGAHPRYARNLGTDDDPATSTRLVASERRICHGVGGFSRVLLPCRPSSNDDLSAVT